MELSEPESPSQRLGRDLPPMLEALVLQCLAKHPDQRPRTAADLGHALVACTDVPPWTEVDATTWWRERSVPVLDLATPLRRAGASSSGHKAVAVNLQGRQPA